MSPPFNHHDAFQIDQDDFPALQSPAPGTSKSKPPTTKQPSSKTLSNGKLSPEDEDLWSTWGTPPKRRDPPSKPAQAIPHTKTAPLLRLPVELHKDIADLISHNWPLSLLNLRRANRYFHALIPPPTHATLLLFEQERWARARPLYACRYCVRLRPKRHFADAMLKGRTGVNGKEPEKRFCVDCGFGHALLEPGAGRQSRYSPGTEVVVAGQTWVWCKGCLQVKMGGEAKGCAGCCAPCHYAEACSCGGFDAVRGCQKKNRRRGGGAGGGVKWGRGLGRDGFGSGYGYGDFDYVFEEYEDVYGYSGAFWECND
jgi:hypothetical protein